MIIKKMTAVLLTAILCLSLVSCGGKALKLKLDKPVTVKYPSKSSATVCCFTAKSEGEYTFTHESGDGVEASCQVYADEELSQPLGHPSLPGNFSFSRQMSSGETVYLQLFYETAKNAKGTITVSRYDSGTGTDINYGHPDPMTLDKAASMENTPAGFPRVFSFTAAGSGTYVFNCTGTDGASMVFYDDPWCEVPSGPAGVEGYPAEHFRTAHQLLDCAALTMAQNETVYFAVIPETDHSNAEVCVTAATNAPDEASALEKFELIKDYHPHLLMVSDVETTFATDFGGNGYFSWFGKAITTFDTTTGLTGNGKDFTEYVSVADATKLDPGTYLIYKAEDLQEKVDALWGTSRTFVACFFDDSASTENYFAYCMYASPQGYILAKNGSPAPKVTAVYKVVGSDVTSKGTILHVKGVSYNASTSKASDIAEMLGGESAFGTQKCSSKSSVDGYLAEFGMNDDDLATVDFVIYNRKDGAKLWGVYLEGQYSGSRIPNSAPALPDVLPDEFEPEYTVTVETKGGVGMRSVPMQNGNVTLGIPDHTTVRCYGEKDGWYYVKYCGLYGWINGEYCVKP